MCPDQESNPGLLVHRSKLIERVSMLPGPASPQPRIRNPCPAGVAESTLPRASWADALVTGALSSVQHYFTVNFSHENQKALELRTEDAKDCDEWVAAIAHASETIMFLHQIFYQGLKARISNWPTLVLDVSKREKHPWMKAIETYVFNATGSGTHAVAAQGHGRLRPPAALLQNGVVSLIECTLLEDPESTEEEAKGSGQDMDHLDFKIGVEPKEAPPFTVILVASSRQEKAAWTSDISQCVDNIRCNGLMMNAFEENSKVTVPQMINKTMNSCKVLQIRYASVGRLLERLTDLRFLSIFIDFLNTFLHSYRVFTSAAVGDPPKSPRATRKFSSPPPLSLTTKTASPSRRRKLSLNIPIITGGKALDLAALGCGSNGYSPVYSAVAPLGKAALDTGKLCMSGGFASKIADEAEAAAEKPDEPSAPGKQRAWHVGPSSAPGPNPKIGDRLGDVRPSPRLPGSDVSVREESDTDPNQSDEADPEMSPTKSPTTPKPIKSKNPSGHQRAPLPQDFETNKELKNKVVGFLEEVTRNPELLTQERKAAANIVRTLTQEDPGDNQITLEEVTQLAAGVKAEPFENHSALEIAEQLTLLDHLVFKKIPYEEFFGQGWMKLEKNERTPYIMKTTKHFNDISNLIASEIIRNEDIGARASAIEKWVAVADICRCLHNYNAVLEIISSMNRSAIFRLKKTWLKVSKQTKALIDKLQKLVSSDGRFKNLREALKNCDPPCVPYLGMYLTDLAFIEEGTPNYTEDGLVNFSKMRMISHIIREIRQFQQTAYKIEHQAKVTQYLLDRSFVMDEESLYEASLRIEPKLPT
ncbi:Ras-specific guanine nucleotide-releasing factor 2 [Myotis davidii]|uniref:Ras-specific guanine nucleotide-releasing factor 2 n=1 Tax=Myotis davidii TaxID=225400 RepID=L5MCC2_MYODS|nr:Ras-specific guanine nucleotide-releasing factor 2 [Myotis davidii]